MKLYKEAERLLEREVQEIVEKGSLDMSTLDVLYKVVDEIKDIQIICAMKREEEGGYSERVRSYDDESYARGRSYARRDSMGRYSGRESYDDPYGSYDRYSSRGYSRDDELDRMMQEAKTEKEKDLIRQLKLVQNH